MPVAERAALAALRADSEDAWAHHAIAGVHRLLRRFDDALAEYELALRLNPNFSLAQGGYSLVLSYFGRWQEASAAARRALRLSPRDPFSAIFNGIAAYAEFVGRNYDEAMRLGARASASAPTSPAAIACSPPPPGWPARSTTRGRRSKRCAACSPICPSTSLPTSCRSRSRPSATTIWRGSGAPAWSSAIAARPPDPQGRVQPISVRIGMAGFGASSSLPRVPAKVCLLNRQPSLRLAGGTGQNAPNRSPAGGGATSGAFLSIRPFSAQEDLHRVSPLPGHDRSAAAQCSPCPRLRRLRSPSAPGNGELALPKPHRW